MISAMSQPYWQKADPRRPTNMDQAKADRDEHRRLAAFYRRAADLNTYLHPKDGDDTQAIYAKARSRAQMHEYAAQDLDCIIDNVPPRRQDGLGRS